MIDSYHLSELLGLQRMRVSFLDFLFNPSVVFYGPWSFYHYLSLQIAKLPLPHEANKLVYLMFVSRSSQLRSLCKTICRLQERLSFEGFSLILFLNHYNSTNSCSHGSMYKHSSDPNLEIQSDLQRQKDHT